MGLTRLGRLFWRCFGAGGGGLDPLCGLYIGLARLCFRVWLSIGVFLVLGSLSEGYRWGLARLGRLFWRCFGAGGRAVAKLGLAKMAKPMCPD